LGSQPTYEQREGIMGTATEGVATAFSAGDAIARDELVSRFLPLARRLAVRYRRPGEPLEDLMQVASLGLLKAIDRFDEARGVPFASYAAPTIDGELKRYLRDTTWAAHVPQRMRERALEVTRATEHLRRTLGRSPTTDEVARDLDVTVTDVLDAAEAATAYDALSLDSPGHPHADDAPVWGDLLGAEERRYDLIEYEVTLGPAMRALPARQRAILRLRFAEDMTQAEIAEALGISQMHVSRLLRQALAKLRAVARARHAP
jgi:RNA polymerase sigma-B factor